MEFNEIITELQNFEGTDEYTDYVTGLMTDDRVATYLDTDAGKKLMQPKLDSYFNKGLETWKGNNLDKLVDEEVAKRYPDQTPEQKRIAELESKFAEAEAKAARSELMSKAIKVATEKKLPTDLVDYFVGKDEETTIANLSKLETALNAQVESIVKQKLGESHKPSADADEGTPDLLNMTREERQKKFRENRHKNRKS